DACTAHLGDPSRDGDGRPQPCRRARRKRRLHRAEGTRSEGARLPPAGALGVTPRGRL
ncbi:MAG: hypothetical protein AVDCRST_MAG72-499, partial [uncultured Nocardioidaceae bacterium]